MSLNSMFRPVQIIRCPFAGLSRSVSKNCQSCREPRRWYGKQSCFPLPADTCNTISTRCYVRNPHPLKLSLDTLPSNLSGTTQASSYIKQGSLSGRKSVEVWRNAIRNDHVFPLKQAQKPMRTHPYCYSGTRLETSQKMMTGRCEPLENTDIQTWTKSSSIQSIRTSFLTPNPGENIDIKQKS